MRRGAAPVLSGDGTERAMLIGQAPGWREIATGLPFAHDAGRRLAGWLALAGVSLDDFRERWYVTSVGKCYPGRTAGRIGRLAPVARRPGALGTDPDEEMRLLAPRAGRAGRRSGASAAFGPPRGSTIWWAGS